MWRTHLNHLCVYSITIERLNAQAGENYDDQ